MTHQPTQPSEEARQEAQLFFKQYLPHDHFVIERLTTVLARFRQSGVEQAEKERDEARQSIPTWRQEVKVWRERIASLEAELARVRKALSGAVYCIEHHFYENVGWQPCDCDQALAARTAIRARAAKEGEAPE